MPDFTNKKIFLYILGGITFTVILIYAIFQYETFAGFAGTFFSAIMPLLSGLVFAFILNVIVNILEQKIFDKINKKFENGRVWNKIRRPLSIVLSYIIIFAVFALVIFYIIPELFRSIESFVETAQHTLPVYLAEFEVWILGLIETYNLSIDFNELQTQLFSNFNFEAILSNVTSVTTEVLQSVLSATMSFASGIVTIFISFVYSIYFLVGKEKLIRNFKQFTFSIIPRKSVNATSMFLRLCNKVFSNYVRGQLTEALILGILCYIGMSIIGLDYALLISTIVTLGAVVPLVGAYIAAFLGGVILLMVNPMDAVWFIVFIVVLQQFEGNFIYPKVVGSSLGLPEIWTLTSVMVMGSLFGITGVLIGPPTLGVIYALVKHNTHEKLKAKGIDEEMLKGDTAELVYKDIFSPPPPTEESREKKQKVNNVGKKIKENLKK